MTKKMLLFLMPSVVQVALQFALLPIITTRLNAADYGLFALVQSLTTLGSPLANMSGTYLISAYYPISEPDTRTRLVSTTINSGLLIILIFAAGITLMWTEITSAFPLFREITIDLLIFSLIALLFSFPWWVTTSILSLDSRADVFAGFTIASAIAQFMSTLVAIFVFNMEVESLFFGALASAGVLLLGAIYSLRKYLRPIIDRSWLIKGLHFAPSSAVGNLMERAQGTILNLTLSTNLGISALGIYDHSLRYRQLAFWFAKAVLRSVWPTTLLEARDTESDFRSTRLVWKLTYAFTTICGLFFLIIGEGVVRVISNNEFTSAYLIIPFWIVTILLQHTGRAQEGILYANDDGIFLSWLLGGATFVSIIFLIALVPVIGMIGGVLSNGVLFVVFRIGVGLRARVFRSSPADDGFAYICMAILTTASAIVMLGTPHAVLVKLGVSLLGITVTAFLARREIMEALARSKSLMRRL